MAHSQLHMVKEIRSKKSCRINVRAKRSSQVGRLNKHDTIENASEQGTDSVEWSGVFMKSRMAIILMLYSLYRFVHEYFMRSMLLADGEENNIVNWFNLIDSRLVSDFFPLFYFCVQRLFDFSHLFSQSFAIKYAYVGQMSSNETNISWALNIRFDWTKIRCFWFTERQKKEEDFQSYKLQRVVISFATMIYGLVRMMLLFSLEAIDMANENGRPPVQNTHTTHIKTFDGFNDAMNAPNRIENRKHCRYFEKKIRKICFFCVAERKGFRFYWHQRNRWLNKQYWQIHVYIYFVLW